MGEVSIFIQAAPAARAEELRRLLNGDVQLLGQEDVETPGCTLVVHEPPEVDALAQLSRLQGPDGIPRAPVIVLSSGQDRRFRRAALRAGAMDVLDRESLTPAHLSSAIEDAIERFSQLRRAARVSAERAEDKFRRNVTRFRRVFETNLLGIFFWDLDGSIHDGNDAFLQLIGYDRADLQAGRIDWRLMTPPEHEAQDRFAIEELRRAGRHTPLEKEYIRKDGSRIWVLVGSACMEGDHGVSFMLDISRQKQTEAALRVSEQVARESLARAEAERAVLDAVLEAAPAAIILAGENGKILRVNPANERFWGNVPFSNSVEEYGVWAGYWADQSERHGRRIEAHEWAMARALRGEPARGDIVEIEPFHKPGTRTTMVNSGAPVRDAKGRITGAVVVQMDISALVAAEAAKRESEERFRMMVEQAAEPFFVHDIHGRFIDVNRRACDSLGFTREELLQMHVHDVEHDFTGEDLKLHWQSLEVGDVLNLLGHQRRKDGTVFPVDVRLASVEVRGQKLFMALVRDVTEQLQAEEELRASSEALREADRRKDEFIAILAHELRNPLAPVRNAVEILRRVATEPRLQKARDVIDRQVTHMARLIDDLLDVSRIARGKLSLQTERCDLAAIARQTTEDYRASLEAAGLSLVVSGSTSPVCVEGDPVRLAQMIGNLLNNAGRFTDRGGRVEVRTEIDLGNRLALVSVSDTGVGIDKALLSRLFDPFSQASQDLARSKGGLGLGLALTKGLAELHGGGVAALSEGAGCGSTFVLRIPLSRAHEEALSMASLTPGCGNGLRVLIIEDNQDAAETLGDLLALVGHEVKLAFDGASGVAAARAFHPDVVISDIGLPGEIDGYGVARALRGDPAFGCVQLIALSGYANDDARRRSREAGFSLHLAKPPDLMALEKALGDAKRRR